MLANNEALLYIFSKSGGECFLQSFLNKIINMFL